jgi:hypothetical protein
VKPAQSAEFESRAEMRAFVSPLDTIVQDVAVTFLKSISLRLSRAGSKVAEVFVDGENAADLRFNRDLFLALVARNSPDFSVDLPARMLVELP